MNPRILDVTGSAIRALHSRRRPTSIDLGLGEPTLRPDIAYFERATRWVAQHGCRYSPNSGEHDLREAIAQHYGYPSLDHADNVCVTTGSQEAVYVAMKTLVDPARDEVLLVEPAFPVYAKIAEIEGLPLRRVTLRAEDRFSFDADRIIAAIGPRTRLLIVCSPCNPTGRIIDSSSVRRLSDSLESRAGSPVYVLHDEIYREQRYIDDLGEFGRHYRYTVSVNSLSKSNALTGLRLGWLMGPADVMPQIVKMHGWATSCASTFAQRVAVEIFRDGALDVQRAWYAAQRDAVVAMARESGLEFVVPDGAFYLCLNVGTRNSLEFCDALLDERDVVAIPGSVFAHTMEGWVRTSFVAPLEQIAEGYRRIGTAASIPTPT